MNGTIGSIAEAKDEYTKQLTNVLKVAVYDKMMDMYNTCKVQTESKPHVLREFQRTLKDVPHWNSTYIDSEIQKINNTCNWFKDLIAAIFISNVKILSSIKVKDSKQKLRLKVPDVEKFVHNVYWKSAENIYNNPTLFSIRRIGETKDDIMIEITNAIDETISNILPFQSILQVYLGESLNGETSDSEDDANNIPGDDEMSDRDPDDAHHIPESSDVPDLPLPESYENQEENPMDSQNNENKNGEGFFDRPGDGDNQTKTIHTQNPSKQNGFFNDVPDKEDKE